MDIDIALWHARLGHVGAATIRETAKAVDGIDLDHEKSKEQLICEPCDTGKNLRYTPKPGRPRPEKAGEEWHLDSIQVTYPGGEGKLYTIILTEAKYSFRIISSFNDKDLASLHLLQILRKAK